MGTKRFRLRTSGIALTVGDLDRVALIITTGASRAEVLFDCEPQVWGLAVEPAGLSSNKERIARLTIRDGGAALKDPGHRGLPVWEWSSQIALEGYVTTDNFGSVVQGAAAKARPISMTPRIVTAGAISVAWKGSPFAGSELWRLH